MSLSTYLKEVKERAEKATEGPWSARRTDTDGTWTMAVDLPGKLPPWLFIDDDMCGWDDAIFIAHSRTDIEKLLAIVEVQRKALERIAEPCSGDVVSGTFRYDAQAERAPYRVASETLAECERIVGEEWGGET